MIIVLKIFLYFHIELGCLNFQMMLLLFLFQHVDEEIKYEKARRWPQYMAAISGMYIALLLCTVHPCLLCKCFRCTVIHRTKVK